MRSADVVRLLNTSSDLSRFALAAGIAGPIGTGVSRVWSPGDALALMILRQLGAPASSQSRWSRFGEGARKCGEALDNGYTPAYLITRGGTENVVVLETEDPAQTDEMVAALLLQASDAGAAVRVVKLRPMVKRLQPFLAELVDA